MQFWTIDTDSCGQVLYSRELFKNGLKKVFMEQKLSWLTVKMLTNKNARFFCPVAICGDTFFFCEQIVVLVTTF